MVIADPSMYKHVTERRMSLYTATLDNLFQLYHCGIRSHTCKWLSDMALRSWPQSSWLMLIKIYWKSASHHKSKWTSCEICPENNKATLEPATMSMCSITETSLLMLNNIILDVHVGSFIENTPVRVYKHIRLGQNCILSKLRA